MESTTIAVDVAKSVFQVAVSRRPGQVSETHRLTRKQLLRFMAKRTPATVVMEACSMAHHWGRQFQQLGHKPKLLPPAYVTPYVLRNKTDKADARAMLEAHRNDDIKPVPVKTLEQHQLAALHRVRRQWVDTRTARINTMRGILRELGLTIPVGAAKAVERVTALIEDADTDIPEVTRQILDEVCQEVRQLQTRIRTLERQLRQLSKQHAATQQMQTIPGIGLLGSTAVAGFIGDLDRFPSGRHFASYLGLTPREHSTALKRRLGSISKQGNVYIRTLLIHGARTMLWRAKRKQRPDRLLRWALQVEVRRGHNKAVVALANKLARILWAVVTRGNTYCPNYRG